MPIIRAPEPRYEPGYVYIFRVFPGVYKIGCSIDPEHRRKTLKRKFPEIEIVHLIKSDDYQNAETHAHRLAQTRHIAAEYYALTALDLEAFRAIKRL